MIPVITNWFKSKAEELLADEQADFRPGQNIAEQIFNSWITVQKHLQHQRN